MTAADVERIEHASALHRGWRVWYAAFGGIGVWTVHLVAESAAVEWAYHDKGVRWLLSVFTVVCVVATVVALALARNLLVVANGAVESADDDAGQLRFLGILGLLVGGINLALIILEGVYVFVVPYR